MDENLQQRVYEFIVKYKKEHDGIAPSIMEIMKETGIKTSSHAAYCLQALERDGLIKRDPGARTIKVTGGQWVPPIRV